MLVRHHEIQTVARRIPITNAQTVAQLWAEVDGSDVPPGTMPSDGHWVSTKRLRLVFHFRDAMPVGFAVIFHTDHDLARIAEYRDWTTYENAYPTHTEYHTQALRHLLDDLFANSEVRWVSGNTDNWNVEGVLHYKGK